MLDSVITQNDLYFRDYAYLKKLGNCYKLIKCNEVRRSGYKRVQSHKDVNGCWIGGYTVVDPLLGVVTRGGKFYSRTYTSLDFDSENIESVEMHTHTNDEKLRNNICRARNKVIEYGLCNDFDYFCTLTLDASKYDRFDLTSYIHDLGIWIQNLNARTDANIKYVLIPEEHKDGTWHLHGFLQGIPKSMLRAFDIHGANKLPAFIVKGIKKGRKFYDFPRYRNKFGYCCLEPVRSKVASVMYMIKYLTKDMSSNVRELGSHLYYCSKGLKKAEIIAQGQWLDNDFNWKFVHKFGSVSFYDSLDDAALEYIKDRIGEDPITISDRKKGYRTDPDGWHYYCDPDTGEIFGGDMSDLEELEEMIGVFSGAYSQDELRNMGIITNMNLYCKENLPTATTKIQSSLSPPAAAFVDFEQLRFELKE